MIGIEKIIAGLVLVQLMVIEIRLSRLEKKK